MNQTLITFLACNLAAMLGIPILCLYAAARWMK